MSKNRSMKPLNATMRSAGQIVYLEQQIDAIRKQLQTEERLHIKFELSKERASLEAELDRLKGVIRPRGW